MREEKLTLAPSSCRSSQVTGGFGKTETSKEVTLIHPGIIERIEMPQAQDE